MQKSDSGRMIAHIDEAKNWLDKARDEYVEANPLRGDLHLNLAQAEVKYAWELSHKRNVLKVDDQRWKQGRNYLIPAAALFIITLVGGISIWYVVNSDRAIKNMVANQSVKKENSLPVPEKTPRKVKVQSAPEIVSNVEKNKISIQTEQQVAPTVPRTVNGIQTEESDVGAKNIPTVVSVNNGPIKKDNAVTSNSNISNERSRGNSNLIKLHPVSTLTIDEEDLTREASKSLRLGK